MKKRDIKELFSKKPEELKSEIRVLGTELKKAVLDKATGKQKNTNLMGALKKDIARIKTVIKMLEIKKA